MPFITNKTHQTLGVMFPVSLPWDLAHSNPLIQRSVDYHIEDPTAEPSSLYRITYSEAKVDWSSYRDLKNDLQAEGFTLDNSTTPPSNVYEIAMFKVTGN